MNRIDPKAPADSPLHPANRRAGQHPAPEPVDQSPVWLRIDGEPVHEDEHTDDTIAIR